MTDIIAHITEHRAITEETLATILLADDSSALIRRLTAAAQAETVRVYGTAVWLRGLIEVSNICLNNCLYCGIRRDRASLHRYRLREEEIVAAANLGYDIGLRTAVMQGGEDPWFTDERLCRIIRAIKAAHPDMAVTLSLGERPEESYRALHDAGTDRYLLRHETATAEHYARLHPAEMSFSGRMECLRALRRTGYQVGTGFMVGSPGQTVQHLAADLNFIGHFRPEMVGIGPFIPAEGTPFAEAPAGSVRHTLRLISIIRLIVPHALIPATTALATLTREGHRLGILAGANVIMPNLTPAAHRADYALYDHKRSSGDEAAEHVNAIRHQMQEIGRYIATDRGDHIRE